MEAFAFEADFERYLDGLKGMPVSPTGWTASDYLDVSERIVRYASAWVDDAGRVVDPNTGAVHKQTTPRFASSVAPLIRMGRCADLLEACARCLDVSCRDIAEGRGEAFDFWTRDLAFAIDCLSDCVDADRVATWKRLLSGFDPQMRYDVVSSKKSPEEMHNWCVYSLTGEQMKRHLGAGDQIAFIDEHLGLQREKFTPLGMYRDPNCPTTYDLAVRQNFVLLKRYGYDGAHRDFVDEMLRRGGLMQLFFQSTTGEVPFGGRSNQFHHVEGMFCCCAEDAAAHYARQGDLHLAGVFKRAARRAFGSVRRWVMAADPPRHIKNLFGPETLHGCDTYGQVSVYSLLAAYQFALAALIANDDIPERAAPCDAGGYVLPIAADFHRVFASCGPLHVQVDLCAQLAFDATGLGRIHHRDCASELGLSNGIVSAPKYRTVEPPHEACAAIGPCWQEADGRWLALAETQPVSTVEVLVQTQSEVAFRVVYRGARTVTETYRLTPEALTLHVDVGAGPVRLTVPVVVTDGEAHSILCMANRAITATYRGMRYRVEAIEEDVSLRRSGVRAPNRNGIYDLAVFERNSGTLSARFVFETVT